MFDQAQARELSGHYLGLANATRIRMVELLGRLDEVKVNDLARELRISQPRVSWHLRMLKMAQVVVTRRDGREVICSLDRASIERYQEQLGRLAAGQLSDQVNEVRT